MFEVETVDGPKSLVVAQLDVQSDTPMALHSLAKGNEIEINGKTYIIEGTNRLGAATEPNRYLYMVELTTEVGEVTEGAGVTILKEEEDDGAVLTIVCSVAGALLGALLLAYLISVYRANRRKR